MANESFFFARFNDRQKLTGAGELLRSLSSVAQWDAVDGFYGLAVRFHQNPEADIQKLKSLDGLAESVECPIASEASPRTVDDELCRAYVLIEVAPERIGPIAGAVKKLEEAQYVGRSDGRFGLIAVLQGDTFDALDSAIENKISSLDGVLRLKEGRIISSYVK